MRLQVALETSAVSLALFLTLLLFGAQIFLTHRGRGFRCDLGGSGPLFAALLDAGLDGRVVCPRSENVEAGLVRLPGGTIDVLDVAFLVDPLVDLARDDHSRGKQGGDRNDE